MRWAKPVRAEGSQRWSHCCCEHQSRAPPTPAAVTLPRPSGVAEAGTVPTLMGHAEQAVRSGLRAVRSPMRGLPSPPGASPASQEPRFRQGETAPMFTAFFGGASSCFSLWWTGSPYAITARGRVGLRVIIKYMVFLLTRLLNERCR